MTDPEIIRQDIELIRENLSDDVDALAYRASPSRRIDERKRQASGMAQSVKEKVMGQASHTREMGGSAASSLSQRAQSGMHQAQQAQGRLREAPGMLREREQGNPLAAGLIAFGVGWLVSSLLPRSGREEQLTGRLRDEAIQRRGMMKGKAGEFANQMRGPAMHAGSAVASSAADAARAMKGEGRSSAHQLRDEAQ